MMQQRAVPVAPPKHATPTSDGAKVRVLIVDDSQTIRTLIRSILSRDPGIDVIGEASHPIEARDAVRALRPDVITLDVEMPHMNGLDFLRRLMARRPTPVIMLSSLTRAGSRAAIEALALGAVDCVEKPAAGITGLEDLAQRIHVAAKANITGNTNQARPAEPAAASCPPLNGRVVCIGASTGGVDALERVLAPMPAGAPPIVITQHMPTDFLRSFASRLDPLCANKVQIAQHGQPISPGNVYIAPGGPAHLTLSASWPPTCQLVEGDKVSGHRPSVDMLFRSATTHGPKMVGVLLTGMGQDGAQGLKMMRDAGAPTLVQDKASAVVFGMPRVALDLGAADTGTPLAAMTDQIIGHCTASKRRAEK